MCVIIIKPAGVEAPQYNVFKACWTANSDGFGYAVANGKDVSISKGYMNMASAWTVARNLPKEQAAILHFRIGTSGKNDGPTCHPYPVSTVESDLRQTEMHNLPMAIAHNGIIGKGAGLLNDTQVWIKNKLTTMCEGEFSIDKVQLFLDMAADLYSSRFSLLLANGTIMRSGKWHEHGDSGLLFSNTSWLWEYESLTSPRRSRSYDYGYIRRGSYGFGFDFDYTKKKWVYSKKDYEALGAVENFPDTCKSIDGVEAEHDDYAQTYDSDVYLYDNGFEPVSLDEYERNLSDGIIPPCPVCGSFSVEGYEYSSQQLCECVECGTVFNGATGEQYILTHELAAKEPEPVLCKAAYVEK